MNELVERLSAGRHVVVINRPDKSGSALKERIDLGYVHVLFEETGTEVGIYLDRSNCDFSNCDFAGHDGNFQIEGVITLNDNKVRCVVQASLPTMRGTANLQPITASRYEEIISQYEQV